MIYLLCRFDPADVRAIVPPDLTPSSSCWGVIALYTVASGWGIAPYSGFFMGLELEGLDSSDTSPSQYMHSGIYSDVGGEVMRTLYNTNFRAGRSQIRASGDEVVGEAGVEGKTLVRLTLDRQQARTPMTGTSRFIGKRAEGAYNSYSVAWSAHARDVTVRSIEFLNGADGVVRVLRPVQHEWTVFLDNMSMAFTPPRPLGDALQWRDHDAQIVGLVGLFSQLGRAAAILTHEGKLLSLNSAAESLVASGALRVARGELLPARPSDQPHLMALLSATVQSRISDKRAFAASDGSTILAQAMALSPDIAGTDKVLVCFDDPSRDNLADPTPALQLLGLTPAEAKIAALVGAGRAPREAADELELTLNTVRSALKIAFDKLGISRQAELARIVARLAG